MIKKIFLLLTFIMLFSCSKEEDDQQTTPTNSNGNATFWVSSNLQVGNISVTCNGITQIISGYYSAAIPSCGASYCANFYLAPGTYSYSAVGGSLSWNGSIVITSGGCSRLELQNDVTNYSLNGRWLKADGLGILISGSNGTFYSFNSGWQSFADAGVVSVGSLKVKNISQLNSATWNCQVLFSVTNNISQSGVAWSNDGTIEMGSDGSYITITATSPFSGDIFTATHLRVP